MGMTIEMDELEGCYSCIHEEEFDTEKEPCKSCCGLSHYRPKEKGYDALRSSKATES